VLDGVGDELATAQWAAAISDPPSRDHRVLVAQENQWRVGFAAFGPAEDEPGAGEKAIEITTLLVEPRWGRRGHGSRLLAAVADLARSAGFVTARAWVLAADSASLAFYRGAGWEPDGTGRAMDMDGTTVHEIRLHASLLADPEEEGEE
jgi:GNAT superfamily N-acetyltransferase